LVTNLGKKSQSIVLLPKKLSLRKKIIHPDKKSSSNKLLLDDSHFVTPVGLKPATPGTGILCSIQLSYGANKIQVLQK
jgi:hypothetical protein